MPQVLEYTNQKVEPLYPIQGGMSELQFMPNITVEKGAVLGQVSAASANEVQTLDFGGTAGNWDMPLMVATSSLTGSSPTLAVTETTAGNLTGIWGLYNDGASDGRETARAIALHSFRTDNFGRVVYAASGTPPEHAVYHKTAPAWFKGRFATTDLTGLDANAVADLGRLESGTVADGVLALN